MDTAKCMASSGRACASFPSTTEMSCCITCATPLASYLTPLTTISLTILTLTPTFSRKSLMIFNVLGDAFDGRVSSGFCKSKSSRSSCSIRASSPLKKFISRSNTFSASSCFLNSLSTASSRELTITLNPPRPEYCCILVMADDQSLFR